MSAPLKVAVIGLGAMAQSVHIPTIRRRWDLFELSALVDISQRRRNDVRALTGVPEEHAYESVADLMRAVSAREVAVDAAVIATDGLRADDVLALLKRAIPVLVEPPLAYSEQELKKIAGFEKMLGRPLVMTAYAQLYDAGLDKLSDAVASSDARLIEYETIMPSTGPLFKPHCVTASAYDVDVDLRNARREAFEAELNSAAGSASTQRDRDLYVKGLLTGFTQQVLTLETTYGKLEKIDYLRQWPEGVMPGSLELLGRLENGAQVRLTWHYLPFFPEYRETIRVISSRKLAELSLYAPSLGDRSAKLTVREKDGASAVTQTGYEDTRGCADAMWDAFHRMAVNLERPLAGAVAAERELALARDLLERYASSEGRELEPAPVVETEESVTEETTVEDGAVKGEPDEAAPENDLETSAENVESAAPADPAEEELDAAVRQEMLADDTEVDDAETDGAEPAPKQD
ncbi:Gfo/Idh/MocA family oxidoreductase [Dermabacteraceae bacterium P7054]